MSIDSIISISSALIAMSALLLAVYQAIKLKSHHKLSVRPFIQFNYRSEFNQKLIINIINGGLGPANLKKLRVIVNGEETDLNEQFWDKYLKEFAGKISVRFYFLSGSDIIQANKDKELIRIETKEKDTPLPNGLEEKIDKICFIITYESFYGEKFVDRSSSNRRRII